MKALPALIVVVMLVLAGCAQAPGLGTTGPSGDSSGTATTTDGGTTTAAATTSPNTSGSPPDPGSDVLGWENGYWYNESIAVDGSDGYDDAELAAVVNRTMARVEIVRQLEFTSTVPVSIVSREEFAKQEANRSTGKALRIFDNAKFEALFLINESADSLAVQQANTGSSVLGYYSPKRDEIVVVSENRSTLQLDEYTLAHELVHAVQDQQFDLSKFNATTRDGSNANSGIIEGDARYTETLYKRMCTGGNWSCLPKPSGESGSGGQLANIGVYLLKYQPYSDGPAFVRQLREQGGWAAVNDVYRDPPASTEQIIHPEKYGRDAPADIRLADRTNGEWSRVKPEGQPNYGSVGEAAVFSMFMYPFYDSGQQTQIIPARSFFNYEEGTSKLREIDPLNYSHRYTEGWDGDRIAVYTNDEGEVGYVWKLKWDSKADAREFLTGYRELLNYWGAEKVDGRTNTWRIPEDRAFGDAFYVQQRGDTVVIVNGPRVGDLPNIRAGAAPAN